MTLSFPILWQSEMALVIPSLGVPSAPVDWILETISDCHRSGELRKLHCMVRNHYCVRKAVLDPTL